MDFQTSLFSNSWYHGFPLRLPSFSKFLYLHIDGFHALLFPIHGIRTLSTLAEKKNKSHLRSYEPYAQFLSWTVWNVSCAIFPISTVWKKWKSVEVQFDYTRWFLGPLDIPHWTFVTNFGLKTNLTLPWSRIRAQRNQGDPRSFFENKIVIIRKDACSIPLRYLGY